jgi:hypothetical protein
VRACAAALTVGLIFWILFYQEKSIREKSRLDLLVTFLSEKSNIKKGDPG